MHIYTHYNTPTPIHTLEHKHLQTLGPPQTQTDTDTHTQCVTGCKLGRYTGQQTAEEGHKPRQDKGWALDRNKGQRAAYYRAVWSAFHVVQTYKVTCVNTLIHTHTHTRTQTRTLHFPPIVSPFTHVCAERHQHTNIECTIHCTGNSLSRSLSDSLSLSFSFCLFV